MRLCILGHSGIGKTPLGRLFKVPTWEPFRVRTPRNAVDAKTCKTQEEADRLEAEQLAKWGSPLYESHRGSENAIRVYRDWSFFRVRGTNQCLEHIEAAGSPGAPLRVEIFAPVLVELLENREKLRDAFALGAENMLFVLLNPTSESFREMQSPSPALCLATLAAITERSRLHAAGLDLAEALRRVEHLKQELRAWKQLLGIITPSVECMDWPHFEFRYSVPREVFADGQAGQPALKMAGLPGLSAKTVAGLENARAELARAGETLLKAIAAQAPHLRDLVKGLMRTPEEIAQITEM